MVKDGKRSTVKVVAVPSECDVCPEENRPLFGCGWTEHAGKGVQDWAYEGCGAPETRTCPMYFARQPFVQSVLQHLEDYRRGALGDVFDLPAPQLEALRVLDGEVATWTSTMQDELSNRGD